jgi:MFS family permease
MSSTTTISLAVRHSTARSDDYPAAVEEEQAAETPARAEQSLAPVDGGFGAWSFLAAAFVVETIVWGFPNAYGVFLDSYLANPLYNDQPSAGSLLPLTGTLSSGIMYCSGPVVYPLISRYPTVRRPLAWFGTFVCGASLFAASYVNNVRALVGLQGATYAIGGALLYAPCISYMSEWFVAKRGLANGILFAGTASGGAVLPLVLPPLIKAHGTSKTLRILSLVSVSCLLPALPFIRGRLPETNRAHAPGRRVSQYAFLKAGTFWATFAVSMLQGFAYFVPIIWLPSFATSLHATPARASLVLSLLNTSAVLGRLSAGFLSDRLDPWALGASTLGLTATATLLLWGVAAHTFRGLAAFALAYGTLAGGFTSLWNGLTRELTVGDPRAATSLFGLLMLSRGLGNVLSTPLSNRIAEASVGVWAARSGKSSTGFAIDGGRYGGMIVYVSTCFAGAAVLAVVWWGMERRRR